MNPEEGFALLRDSDSWALVASGSESAPSARRSSRPVLRALGVAATAVVLTASVLAGIGLRSLHPQPSATSTSPTVRDTLTDADWADVEELFHVRPLDIEAFDPSDLPLCSTTQALCMPDGAQIESAQFAEATVTLHYCGASFCEPDRNAPVTRRVVVVHTVAAPYAEPQPCWTPVGPHPNAPAMGRWLTGSSIYDLATGELMASGGSGQSAPACSS